MTPPVALHLTYTETADMVLQSGNIQDNEEESTKEVTPSIPIINWTIN